MKQFIFLYPIPEIINAELQYKEKIKESYQIALNKCIDLRYRKQGFIINYAIFDDTSISSVIKLQKSDKIIKVGLDFKTHITKQPNGKYPSPNQNYILNQLGEIKIIRIGGFHKQDCVEKLAKRAYEKGIDTLVDEDLTEFFIRRFRDSKFDISKYPGFSERIKKGITFKSFIEEIKDKPWLWQDY